MHTSEQVQSVTVMLQEEVEELQQRLSTMDSQLSRIVTAAQEYSVGNGTVEVLPADSPVVADSGIPALAAMHAALQGLVEGKKALEAQVQELNKRCRGLGAAN
jgi:prefoldin subunit 5